MIILLPVYNDWKSLNILLLQLQDTFGSAAKILIVDDGSTEEIIATDSAFNIQIIHLTQNLGHQKAIAIGLSYISENFPQEDVLIMDADGNDLPSDAMMLKTRSQQNPGKIILAARNKRNENGVFKLMYFFFLLTFRFLTGKKIRYGNFCFIPFFHLQKIIHLSNIWLHLPAAIVKSKIPFEEVVTNKGKRLQGKSKMKTSSFFYHGLGAIAVFTDVIAIRLLIGSLIAIFISLVALTCIITIRLTTDLAIPGWASAIGSSLIIIILLSFLMSILLIFIFIISQSSRKFIPAIHYKDYLQPNKN